MRALVFGDDPWRSPPPSLLSAVSPRAFVGTCSARSGCAISPPALPAPDWAIARTRLCGLCGRDQRSRCSANERFDNLMTAMTCGAPGVGHEVVGVIDEVGPGVTQRAIGQQTAEPVAFVRHAAWSPGEIARGGRPSRSA